MKTVLYYNGSILTMNKSAPRAEALLTGDKKIISVGNLSELERIADKDTVKVDLDGKTLMPAFVDGHSHVVMHGSMLNKCDLSECRSFDEILSTISDFRIKNNLVHGEKISCYGYDLSIIKEGAHPTAAVLDKLEVDNPIGCTHASFHMGVYNTVAMKGAGIDDSYTFIGSGVVGRDSEGHLNGYFEEGARRVMTEFMAKGSTESFEDSFLRAQECYLKNGITTIQDGGNVKEPKLENYKALAARGKIIADVVLYLEPRLKDPTFWQRALSIIGKDSYENHVKIGGVKMVLDGSPQAKTAWMSEPYEGESEYKGYPNLKDETVYAVLKRGAAENMQVLAHCNGDAAAEQYLSAWERVVTEVPAAKNIRPVMIHAQTVRYDQLDRISTSGMICSFFVGHCYYWGDTHLKNFGAERGSKISPVRAAMERGIPLNFHQDSPVTQPNMLHSIWCAVNRITRSGKVVGEDNKIDVYDALIAATNGGAYAYFEEDEKGILSSGAVADLIILDKDPTAIDSMEIKNVKVLKTIKDGKVVYSAVM